MFSQAWLGQGRSGGGATLFLLAAAAACAVLGLGVALRAGIGIVLGSLGLLTGWAASSTLLSIGLPSLTLLSGLGCFVGMLVAGAAARPLERGLVQGGAATAGLALSIGVLGDAANQFTGLTTPNLRGIAAAVVVVVASTPLTYSYGRPFLSIGFVALAGIAVTLTLSRTAIFAFALVLVFRSWSMRRPGARTWPWALGVIGLAAAAIAALRWEPLVSRFRPTELDVFTTGRTVVWESVLQSWSAGNELLGQGAGSSEVLVLSMTGVFADPHNYPLRLLHDLGFVGLALFTGATLFILGRIIRNRSELPNSPELHSALGGFSALLAFSLTGTVMSNLPVVAVAGFAAGVGLACNRGSPR